MKKYNNDQFYTDVSEAILHRLRSGSNEKFTSDLIEKLKSKYEDCVTLEQDYRNGEETYGYDAATIDGNLSYISDRWRCAFRIKWIIDGLENGMI